MAYNILYCDNTGVILSYIADITDTTKYSPSFINLFALSLAQQIAYSVTKDQKQAQLIYEKYGLAYKNATGSNARQRGSKNSK